MISKPDRECEKRGDIALLSEIISNFMYWQAILNSSIPLHPPLNYYNVVLFCKFLTMRTNSSRYLGKFLIKHRALTRSETLIDLSLDH